MLTFEDSVTLIDENKFENVQSGEDDMLKLGVNNSLLDFSSMILFKKIEAS